MLRLSPCCGQCSLASTSSPPGLSLGTLVVVLAADAHAAGHVHRGPGDPLVQDSPRSVVPWSLARSWTSRAGPQGAAGSSGASGNPVNQFSFSSSQIRSALRNLPNLAPSALFVDSPFLAAPPLPLRPPLRGCLSGQPGAALHPAPRPCDVAA